MGVLLLILLVGAGIGCTSPDQQKEKPVRSLPTVGAASWQALLDEDIDSKDADKEIAAIALGMSRQPNERASLERCVREERSPAVRAACARSLGLRGDKEGLPALLQGSEDRREVVRIASINALGKYSNEEALNQLKKLAAAGGPEGKAALEALGQSSAPGAGTELAKTSIQETRRFRRATAPHEAGPRRTWYIDASAKPGGRGSVDEPFSTLKQGLDVLLPGDRLLATSGAENRPFFESIDLKPGLSGRPAQPTILAAWPGRNPPLLDGKSPNGSADPSEWREVGIQIGASHALIQGFHLRHFDVSGIHIGDAEDSVVEGCIVRDCNRHGIFAYYAPRSSIVDSEVWNCQAQGISLRSSPGSVVAGGSSRNNGIDGLLLLQESDEVVVTDFSASGNRRGIALIEGSDRVRILNSTLEGNQEGDLVIDEGSDATLIGSVAVEVRRPPAPPTQASPGN